MRLKRIGKILAIALALYVVFPFIAGLFAIGDRDGPKIYRIEYHTHLYMIGYETVRDEKPRENPFFDRPWFYGFPRRQIRPIEMGND